MYLPMSLADDLSKLGDDEQRKRVAKSIPAGFEPGIEYDSSGGVLRSVPRPAGDEPDHAELLAEFELDPAKWRITGLRRSKWQRWDEQWLESFRATFVPTSGALHVDPQELLDIVAKWKPRKGDSSHTAQRSGTLAYVVVLADTQVGKIDGDGSEGIIQNVLHKTDLAVARLKELRKAGRDIGTVYLPQLGDCIEGMNSQGGKHIWRTDLDLTAQIRVYRRLLLHMVKAFAPLADKVIVPCVPGNHDEAVRVGNSMATTYTDSFALDAASAVADALADHPDFKHVSFVFPKYDTLTVTLDMAGTVVGLAHGHQCRGKAIDWWKNQAHGQQDIGEATLLLTGHYHHLRIEQSGRKTWMQAPALDGGSTWFENSSGQAAPAGMLTLTVGNGGWSNVQIL
jgi:predicted phosphodiesterase